MTAIGVGLLFAALVTWMFMDRYQMLPGLPVRLSGIAFVVMLLLGIVLTGAGVEVWLWNHMP